MFKQVAVDMFPLTEILWSGMSPMVIGCRKQSLLVLPVLPVLQVQLVLMVLMVRLEQTEQTEQLVRKE